MSTQPTASQRTRHIAALGLALLLLVATLTAVAAQAAPPAPAALDGRVTWDPNPVIVSNGQRIAYPWSAMDSNGVTHAIYMTFDGDIMYTNRSGGVINKAGKRLDSGGDTPPAEPFAAIAIGPNNTIHVVYTRFNVDNQLYYRQSGDGGLNWTVRQHISSGGFKAATPHLVVDPVNNAHIVWNDDRCGKHNVFYRIRRADGSLGGIEHILDKCSSFQKKPQITYSDDKPHVVFQIDGAADVVYRRRDDDGVWRGRSIAESNNINSQSASIASDGRANLFVVWDENVGGHDIYFRWSFDGGFSWTANKINLSQSSELSRYPNVTWSAAAQRAIIVWEDAHGARDGQTEIWERQFDPVTMQTTFADQISHFNGRSQWPTVASGGNKADIAWMDEPASRGNFQAYSLEGTTGTLPCEGSLLLEGGVDATRDRSLSGTIAPANSCVPDQMQVSLDVPITNATPKIAYNASIPPQTVPDIGCSHRVYVRLFKNGVGGNIFWDDIQVDSAVEASVRMTNPHLFGLTSTGNAPGAPDGDPRYTREQEFYLAINEMGECTGLKNYSVQGGSTGAIPEAGFSDMVGLPGGTTQGARAVNVTVTDKINNSQNYQAILIFDTGAPTLNTTANPTVTMPLSTTTIIVPLSFDNIRVNDTIYGDAENLDPGKQFWGAWIAVSRTPTAPATTDLARWSPVQVLQPDSTFTINFSLFSGLPSQSKTAGDYYVFVKFLDGAGNFTANTIESAKITLQSGFDRPTLYAPIVQR